MTDLRASVPAQAQGALPACLICGGTLERVRRSGFLQQHVMPLFTRYPWRCVLCHDITFRSARHRRELRRQFGVSK